MKKLKGWWRKRRLIKIYIMMGDIAYRHKAAGHDVEFTAVNEATLVLRCSCKGNLY